LNGKEGLLVSIIVPCFNCENYVQEAVGSILYQTYRNIEVIVVNDGSTDSSLQKLQSLAEKSPQLKIINQENSGTAAAKNCGLRAARGDFISFLDADDYWHPRKIEFQVKALAENPGCSICFCDFIFWHMKEDNSFQSPNALFDLSTEQFQLDVEFSGWIYHRLLIDSYVSTITVMFRRETIQNIGYFDTTLLVGEDHDYWLRAAADYEFIKINEPLALYRKYGLSVTEKVHDKNYSALVFERAVERFGLKSKNGEGLSQKEANEQRYYLWFRYAYQCFWGGDSVKARSAFLKALKLKKQLKLWGYMLLTCPPFYQLVRGLYHPHRGFSLRK